MLIGQFSRSHGSSCLGSIFVCLGVHNPVALYKTILSTAPFIVCLLTINHFPVPWEYGITNEQASKISGSWDAPR